MANIMEILGRIKTAIYGRDVRQSIYDAILQCYNDATGNPESIAAHTGDTNNPHNVTADQVGLGTAAEDISGLKNPEFEDFAADGSTPPDARTAIAAITSKMSFFTYLSKVKAALMGLVTLGEMRSLLINNGLTTEVGKYPLDAAYGKTLLDKITKLNSETYTLYEGTLKVGDTFSLSENISLYNIVRIQTGQNNLVYSDNIITSDKISLLAGLLTDVSGSGVFVLMDFAAATSDGKNYTVVRNTQVNINESGVQYLIRDISSQWKIIGIK